MQDTIDDYGDDEIDHEDEVSCHDKHGTWKKVYYFAPKILEAA
jgi:hypothetical protein